MTTVAILNPKAGRGKAAALPALPDGVEVLETERPGHATDLARDAIKRGAESIIAAGGDGTLNEIVNGFFEDEEPIGSDVTLQIIPRGTGSDFFRTARQQRGDKRLIDLMKVRYASADRPDGRPQLRYAINVVSFGMGGAVAAKVNRSSKRFGGRIAYLSATVQTLMSFAGNAVTLRLDNSRTVDVKITNVAAGNGQYQGAGMWICPGAMLDDGLLDITVIRYLKLFELVRSFPVLYNGGIYSHPKVQSYRARYVAAQSREPVPIEIDGEAAGRLPIEISVLPQAIRILLP